MKAPKENMSEKMENNARRSQESEKGDRGGGLKNPLSFQGEFSSSP